jgi:hypothetical protein
MAASNCNHNIEFSQLKKQPSWLILHISKNEIPNSKKGFGGLSTGDIAILGEAKSIKVDAFTDTWFAFQQNDGDKCRGDLITRLNDGDCVKVAPLGIGCTRLCGGGLGGGDCASNEKPL